MGCRIRRLRTGMLALRLRWTLDGLRFDTQEATGLRDTPEHQRILRADFCEPIKRDMKARRFTRERYLELFPYGTRAAEFRRDLGVVIAEQPARAAEGVTLSEYYRQWIDRKTPPFVRVSRRRDYIQHFTAYVLPFFGETTRLADLRLDDLVRLRNHMSDQRKLSPSTVQSCINSSLRAMLREAAAEGHATLAIYEGLDWPDRRTFQPDPFTLAERNAILEYYRDYLDGHYFPLVATLALTGMRPGEATALRVRDVDLTRRTLSISKSRNLRAEEAPKTRRSVRTIGILVELADALGPLTVGAEPSRHLFRNIRGGPVNQDEWRKTSWKRCLEAGKIRHRHLYALRDTFISLALSDRAAPIGIANYCGTSLQVIDQSYGKYIPSDDRGILAHVEAPPEAKTGPDHEHGPVSGRKSARSGASPTGFEGVAQRRRHRHTLDRKRNNDTHLLTLVRKQCVGAF